MVATGYCTSGHEGVLLDKTKIRKNLNVTAEWSMAVDEAVAAAAKEMCEEIDFSILADMLVITGWTSVEVPFWSSNYQAIDVEDWLAVTCQGQFKKHNRRFLFEYASDANWFKLRWLT